MRRNSSLRPWQFSFWVLGAGSCIKIYEDHAAFNDAAETNLPASYSEYLARPDAGRKDEAKRLYVQALETSRRQMREKQCLDGKEPVVLLEMIDFAEKSGNDEVGLVINRHIDIPHEADGGSQTGDTIPLRNGKRERVISAADYFERVPAEDELIVYDLPREFDDRLRGVLDFRNTSDPQHMILQIDYNVGATGKIYTVEQKKTEDSNVTLMYHGLEYKWSVELRIPVRPVHRFTMNTQPSATLDVRYRRPDGWSNPGGPDDFEVYSAMQINATDTFYKELSKQLCAATQPSEE